MSRILVIDDNKQVCQTLTALLSKNGYQVASAISGPLALASYASFHPDLVFLDLVMPGMNGMTVLRQFLEWDANLPVVVLTGVSDDKIAKDAIAQGARDFITKPIKWEQLETVLEVYLLMR